MPKLFVMSLSILAALNCHAEQVRISCTFGPPLAMPEMDAEAKDLRLYFQASNLERVVLLELNPPKVLNKNELFRLFPEGPTRVAADGDEISVIWKAESHPRRPVMSLAVNRFSLEAVEFYQIGTPDGRGSYYWTRRGKCKVDDRKF